jgi:hypothetical protein
MNSYSHTFYRNRARTNHSFIEVLSSLIMLGLLPSTVAMSSGGHFKSVITSGDYELPIRGADRLRWKGLISVYDLALYMPRDVPSSDVFNDVPKRLEFRYHVGIDAEDFAEAAEPYLKKNVAPDELAKIRDKIDFINSLYRDVKKGDRYSLTYIPGKGTELALNSKVLGVIEGADFANAYFRIWLGEDPIDLDMRRTLLKE